MKLVGSGRFILRFALVTIILAWWCPFILSSRLRSFPTAPGERLTRLKAFARRWALVFAINLAVTAAVGYGLGNFRAGLGLDLPAIAVASLAIVLLWRATEMVWPEAESSAFHPTGDLRGAITRESATLILRLIFVMAATLIFWQLLAGVRPCLPFLDALGGQCTATDILRRIVKYAYSSPPTNASVTYPDYDSAFRDGIAVAIAYAVLVAFLLAMLAIELSAVLVWRMAEVVVCAWRAVEDSVSKHRLSPFVGLGFTCGIALLPAAVAWKLVIVLLPHWKEALLGPIFAAMAAMLDANTDTTKSLQGAALYFPPIFIAAAGIYVRRKWRRLRLP